MNTQKPPASGSVQVQNGQGSSQAAKAITAAQDAAKACGGSNTEGKSQNK